MLSGVAILHPDGLRYVRRYGVCLRRDLDRHGELSEAAAAWLKRHAGRSADDYGADFRYSQQFETPAAVARAMSDSPGEFYGGFVQWLDDVAGPYDVLAGWAARLQPRPSIAVDAGCGCGGLLSRVAASCVTGLGLDLSFLAVLLARRALLHLPQPERTYLLSVHRGHEVERPLALPPADNCEFVVGDCAAPPLPDGIADLLLSANVIDIAGVEPVLNAAARVLRPGGSLLLCDPFLYREKEAPAGDPTAALRADLARRGLRITRTQDGVPWVWSTYDRHWRVYFNLCLEARRDGS